ncbi:MAG: hypothetical protein JWP01_530 [Myxococcales bacterium]|nr:hypothetical protein [Myxococcales bacterium]
MRSVLGILALACSTPAPTPPADHAVAGEVISVPTGRAIAAAPPTAVPDNSLAADEGTLAIVAPHPTTLGVATTARIRVVPGAGYHINTRYPFVVSFASTENVTVAKPRLEGGRNGIAGDAEILAETELSIPVTVIASTPGEHTVNGQFHVGICKSDVCLTRSMPVTFTVAASR